MLITRSATRFFTHFGIALLALPFLLSSAEGRWATEEDADSTVEAENIDIQVRKDGTYTGVFETETKVLKDSARSNVATEQLGYNSKSSELKVLDARTILPDGREKPVEPQFIEDKPLASSPNGFDQHNQVMIAYQDVSVGSKVRVKYRTTEKEPSIPGFFGMTFSYGNGMLERSGLVRIRSELPLYIRKNDPLNALEVHHAKNEVTIRLKKPVYRRPVDEAGVSLSPSEVPWIDVGTTEKWADLTTDMAAKYEAVLKQPLPPAFAAILEKARKKNGLIEQANVITSELAEAVTYLGDWRPVSGRFVPRDLTTIAGTKRGDCKDYSAATASILRRLGHQTHLAWVRRSAQHYNIPNRLPSLSAFNHAIVHVKTEQGSVWLDPTNFASYAQGTFNDIADRPSLILDPQSPRLAQIPQVRAEDNRLRYIKEIDLTDGDELKVSGKVELSGLAAVPFTGVSLKASRQSTDYLIIRSVGDENRILDWKVDKVDLSSRIVGDIQLGFKFREKSSDLKTSAGPAHPLAGSGKLVTLMTKTGDRVSDLFLGSPSVLERQTTLKGVSALGEDSLNCNISTPWVDAMREVTQNDHGIQVNDRVQIKTSIISNKDMASRAYQVMQDQVYRCFNGAAIVYQAGLKRSPPQRSLSSAQIPFKSRVWGWLFPALSTL